MGLKKFEDFEHSLEEDDKKKMSEDVAGAKKALLASFKPTDNPKLYWSKKTLIEVLDGDTIAIELDDERTVMLKIVGFDIR